MRLALLAPLLLAACAAPERAHLETHGRPPPDPYLVRDLPGEPSDVRVLRRTTRGPLPDDLAGLERAVGIGPAQVALGAATIAVRGTAAEVAAAERFLADRAARRGDLLAIEARVLRLPHRHLPSVDGLWPAGRGTVATIVSSGAPLAALWTPPGGGEVEPEHVASATTTRDGVEVAAIDVVTQRSWIAGYQHAGHGVFDPVLCTDEDRALLAVLPWLTGDGRALLNVRLELTLHDTDGRGPPVRQAWWGGAPELDLTPDLPRTWSHLQFGRAHLAPATCWCSSRPRPGAMRPRSSW